MPPCPRVSDEWETFVDEGRGLSIPVPLGWIFVDPSEQELSDFFAEAGELAGSDEIQQLLAYIVNLVQQQGDLIVGMGFQVDSGSARDLEFLNNVNVIAVSPEGLTLPLMAKLSAAQLDAIEGIEVESAGGGRRYAARRRGDAIDPISHGWRSLQFAEY